MSRLRKILIEQYASHYERVNESIHPVPTPKEVNNYRLQYGATIQRALDGGTGEILDLGCGTGKLLHWLGNVRGVRAVGVDASPTQIAIGKKALNHVDLVCEDGLSFLARNPGRFTGIICNDVIEHIETLDECLEFVEAARTALRPGGFFTCRAPNGANMFASYSRYMDLTHERCFTSTSMVQLLEAAGLRDCHAVPLTSAHVSGKVRLVLERILHAFLFRITGRAGERIFTSNVHAIGFQGGLR